MLDQRQTNPSQFQSDWRRPARICASLAVLGALLGGAMWMQNAGPASQPKTHGYPLMPTVPLKIGFYDMHGRSAVGDPVLKQFGKMHLDYVLLLYPPFSHRSELAMLPGMVSTSPGSTRTGFITKEILGRHAWEQITPIQYFDNKAAPGEHEEDHVTLPPAVYPMTIGTCAQSRVGDRVIRLAVAALPADSRRAAFEALEKDWENLAAPPAPLPPIIVALDLTSRIDAADLVHPTSGWFDASSVFWDKSAAPPAGHLLFSSGWSLTGGQVVRDPHDPQHRVGWVITTAGAAPPATQAAGEGEE